MKRIRKDRKANKGNDYAFALDLKLRSKRIARQRQQVRATKLRAAYDGGN